MSSYEDGMADVTELREGDGYRPSFTSQNVPVKWLAKDPEVNGEEVVLYHRGEPDNPHYFAADQKVTQWINPQRTNWFERAEAARQALNAALPEVVAFFPSGQKILDPNLSCGHDGDSAGSYLSINLDGDPSTTWTIFIGTHGGPWPTYSHDAGQTGWSADGCDGELIYSAENNMSLGPLVKAVCDWIKFEYPRLHGLATTRLMEEEDE
ncbi:hypothetical protein [Actinomadura atramentaria]|uniref:hypothetical protein n=1 Tax=Actinomadura atramentaria TaxID=1990 RepID=UPI000370051A|nr:hypothetical protein [Actinomadura atramentaria]